MYVSPRFVAFLLWNGVHVKTCVVFVTRQSYSSALRNVYFPKRLHPSGCHGIDTDPGMFNTTAAPNICSVGLHYHQNDLGGAPWSGKVTV